MKAKIEVFTSPTCPHCPSAIRLAKELASERDDVRVIESSLAIGKNRKRAERLGVMSTPTLFITGPAIQHRIGFRGTPSKKSLIKAVNIALGLEEMEEPEPVGEKIKRFLKEKLKIKV